MLLVYCKKVTNRAGYVFNLIFKTILGTEFEITSDTDYFANHNGTKVCYNSTKFTDNCIFVKSTELLFQHSIDIPETHCFDWDGVAAFFGTNNSDADLPFDIFAASFFLATRYEEYLPFKADDMGCYDVSNSLAYKNGFLEKPVIDIWAWRMAEAIHKKFPSWEMPKRYFNFITTVNIGQAYKYKRIGMLRTIYGYFNDALKRDWPHVKQRTQVLLNRQPDPYDKYETIVNISAKYSHKLVFWALMCDYSPYDHNISYRNQHLRDMLKNLADFGKVGISLSYESEGELQTQTAETERLADVLHKPVIRSRFNNLRFMLPLDYKNLNKIGIEKDFSMGYRSTPGFRAGTCTPFHFFNIDADREYPLLVFPTPLPEQLLTSHSATDAVTLTQKVIAEVAAVNGTFVSTWKLDTLSNSEKIKAFEETLALCKNTKDNNQLKNR